ncbi:class I SAM-dependent methyltransferase [Magnetospirillum sp. 64-120]|uniref:class I SAM-dependent methyltransferase n=1 Tax=Magnetospirillum sp. 64-120 TaxID=1895778 RepID=UPI000925FBFF|nr:class I SAM-dependent methyltransferase [Magnetospirillum sp. 64-120]OJX68195.1 MAG: hypothetical protein BGO92_05950 [Magnetospirillum sp. 64-120]
MSTVVQSHFTCPPCPLCLSASQELIAVYDHLGPGEKDLKVGSYYRELWRCPVCGHLRNLHDHDLDSLYQGGYNAAAFTDGLKRQFERVMSLPREQSDNWKRVDRILDYLGAPGDRTALDIGSGSAVFPAAMRQVGWNISAMDPDTAAVAHAKSAAGVDAFVGDAMTSSFPSRYDLITFNKVLEHIKHPVKALTRAKAALKPGGWLYVELPDGEEALHDGLHRQEFFLEHWHAFSVPSIALLARRAGLRAESIGRTRCPSGKYTLHAFMIERTDYSPNE